MSGIYIPGMEMPKEDEISKCFLIRHDGEVWVVEFDNLISDLGYVACYPTNPAKAIPVPDHGRLIDADEFLKRAIGTKCFCGDYALMLEELVGESTTIIPAEEGET